MTSSTDTDKSTDQDETEHHAKGFRLPKAWQTETSTRKPPGLKACMYCDHIGHDTHECILRPGPDTEARKGSLPDMGCHKCMTFKHTPGDCPKRFDNSGTSSEKSFLANAAPAIHNKIKKLPPHPDDYNWFPAEHPIQQRCPKCRVPLHSKEVNIDCWNCEYLRDWGVSLGEI